MKLKIDRKAFAQALADAAPLAAQKSPLAILKYAKITAKGDRIKVDANNGQDSISRYLNVAECDQDGSFLVNVADFGRFVAAACGEFVEVEADGELVTVSHEKGRGEFSSPNAAEYPAQGKAGEEEARIFVSASALADCIENAAPYISSDTFHPQMCAIYATAKGGALEYCGTDTRMLLAGSATMERAEGEGASFYVMPSAFKPLLKMCKAAEGDVEVRVSPSGVSYRASDTVLRTLQVKGKFPDYKRVIPQSWAMECSVSRDELMESVKRAAMFCEASRMVKLSVSPLCMAVSASNLADGKQSSETVAHGGCAGEVQIGLHADCLVTVLSTFGQGDVLMRITDCARPVVFAQESKQGVTALLMPMNINS